MGRSLALREKGWPIQSFWSSICQRFFLQAQFWQGKWIDSGHIKDFSIQKYLGLDFFDDEFDICIANLVLINSYVITLDIEFSNLALYIEEATWLTCNILFDLCSIVLSVTLHRVRILSFHPSLVWEGNLNVDFCSL